MVAIQPLSPKDAPVVAVMRQAAAAHKGEILGAETRPMFDAMFAATPPAANVRAELGLVGRVPGVWLRPVNARKGGRVLFLHGGGYVLGSATAFGSFAGQIATRAGADAFVADYRLAPEHPFPAAIDDAVTSYRGLVADGAERIVVVGDSAGGGLALALLSILAAQLENGALQPVGAAVMSPWTDLALTGASFDSRAEVDPIFTRGTLVALANLYLQGHDASDPKASPLYARLAGPPPIRIDVGNDEVLLDDSRRYAELAQAAGVDVTLSIWTGMPHVFQSSLGAFVAAEQSMNAIGEFLRNRLSQPTSSSVS
jgi:monoterpene epsilon-lactone hydrolase